MHTICICCLCFSKPSPGGLKHWLVRRRGGNRLHLKTKDRAWFDFPFLLRRNFLHPPITKSLALFPSNGRCITHTETQTCLNWPTHTHMHTQTHLQPQSHTRTPQVDAPHQQQCAKVTCRAWGGTCLPEKRIASWWVTLYRPRNGFKFFGCQTLCILLQCQIIKVFPTLWSNSYGAIQASALHTSLPLYIYLYLSICLYLFISLPIYPSISLSLSISISLSLPFPLCIPLYLSRFIPLSLYVYIRFWPILDKSATVSTFLSD
jgi:hypothetical protein